MHEQHQQPEQQQQQEPNRKALDSKIESLIENTISNANCDASNTERTNAKVNDEHRQRKDDDEIACDALRWRWNDIGNVEYDGYGDDNDNELAAGNTTNPTENGASQRNFSPNKKQRKIECDNIADDTHKLFAKSNDLVGGASVRAGATIADNNNRNTNNNHNANRYECIDALPLTMIQCTFRIQHSAFQIDECHHSEFYNTQYRIDNFRKFHVPHSYSHLHVFAGVCVSVCV